MCGIAGTLRIGDRDLVARMTALMAYRGPDDHGLYEDGDVRLGHCRLSIIDLSAAGHQPMASVDGQIVITFNGEIYNYRELRAELEARGHQFRTGTDTETILAAYREFGSDCLERLEGIFAFGLWDGERRELMLARDRTGIKPLFYTRQGDGLAFASELKPLLLLPGLERRVHRPALRSALRYSANLEDESMLQSIFKLRPGHRLLWRDGTCRHEPYWRHPLPAPEKWDESVLADTVRERLSRVVEAQMISDAPLGAALSGGLDSSGVVALMARAADAPVETFTVGHGQDDPDLLSARRVAEHCRTNHHEVIISSENIAELLPRVVWHLEEPLGEPETISMYANYREARRFVKVLLIGEGADECFGGYGRYRAFDPRLPLPLGVRKDLYERAYFHADAPPRTRAGRALARCAWGSAPPSPLLDPRPVTPLPLDDLRCSRHGIEWALSHDQRTYLPHLVLKRADALGMAHSVELRVPFLDRTVVELAARVPGSFMLRGGVEKYILRRALAPLLPPEITARRKRPFQMRLTPALLEALDLLGDRLLRPSDVRARGFFEPCRVEALRRGRPGRHASGPAHTAWASRVWSMLLCEVWARLFLDRPASSPPPGGLAEIL